MKKGSIFNRSFIIALSTGLGLLIIVVATLIGYRFLFIQNSIVSNSEESNSQVDLYINEYFENVKIYQKNLLNTGFLHDFKEAYDKESYFVSYLQENDSIPTTTFNFSLIYKNNYYSQTGENFFIDSEILSKLDRDSDFHLLGRYKYFNGQYTTVYGNKVEDVYVIYYFKEEGLSAFLQSSKSTSISYVVDDKNLIYIGSENNIYSHALGVEAKTGNVCTVLNKRYFVNVNEMQKISNTKEKYYLVNLIDYDSAFLAVDIYIWVSAVLAGAVFVFVSTLMLLRIKQIIKPINKVSKEISELDLEHIDSNKLSEIKPQGNEIDILENSYFEMVERISALMKKQKEDSRTQRKLEYDALQMQINPHFLYNALDCIAWMAKIYKVQVIEDFVIALARFYRLSLHKGEKFIKVKDEIDIAKYFLDIQKMRSDMDLNYEIDVDYEVEDCQSLKLILQPFIENSVKYAFNESESGNLISIKAYKENDLIVYEIIDNGCGFDTNVLNKNEESIKGFGIKNVTERIKLEYGEKGTVQVISDVGKGTKVIITIPVSF